MTIMSMGQMSGHLSDIYCTFVHHLSGHLYKMSKNSVLQESLQNTYLIDVINALQIERIILWGYKYVK